MYRFGHHLRVGLHVVYLMPVCVQHVYLFHRRLRRRRGKRRSCSRNLADVIARAQLIYLQVHDSIVPSPRSEIAHTYRIFPFQNEMSLSSSHLAFLFLKMPPYFFSQWKNPLFSTCTLFCLYHQRTRALRKCRPCPREFQDRRNSAFCDHRIDVLSQAPVGGTCRRREAWP